VLVRIHAVGVNPYDTYMRNGVYAIKPPLPYTPGSDGAGVIKAAGEGVNNIKKGDRVYVAKAVTGAYAEYALTLESQVHPLPDNITYAGRIYRQRRPSYIPQHRNARCRLRSIRIERASLQSISQSPRVGLAMEEATDQH
jgi:hypothetical protein